MGNDEGGADEAPWPGGLGTPAYSVSVGRVISS